MLCRCPSCAQRAGSWTCHPQVRLGCCVCDFSAWLLASQLSLLCAGTKPELQTRLLARFALSAPASASHKLIFHYKMHNFILKRWASELQQHASPSISTACCNAYAACGAPQSLPVKPPGYFPGRPMTGTGKAMLAPVFDSWAAMQQAVSAERARNPKPS